jgi:hypothetical protein
MHRKLKRSREVSLKKNHFHRGGGVCLLGRGASFLGPKCRLASHCCCVLSLSYNKCRLRWTKKIKIVLGNCRYDIIKFEVPS